MTAQRVAGDTLPVHVDGKGCGDQSGQFLGDVGPHAEMLRPRLLGRIDVKAGALAEIPGFVVRHAFAAGRSVRGDEGEAAFGAGAAIFAFVRDVGVGSR